MTRVHWREVWLATLRRCSIRLENPFGRVVMNKFTRDAPTEVLDPLFNEGVRWFFVQRHDQLLLAKAIKLE